MEELIYRRDCDLFAESLDYESMIHDTMVEYGLIYNYDFDEEHIFDFARTILQKAQNVIDSADTVAYEKEKYEPSTNNTIFTFTRYLTYEKDDNE